ncbi:Putative Vacuolar sorting-associated protein [Aspergillus calidoustus]|uniref:Putative Vacuolar sorting-associated protein n=1 Tax=Aspergillus calidoustus TaxID=454130 RepID=A0A0U5GP89_ASPCI|nr:Putative Vacuolar sorting-associated protein [Aspergillus calidoustus]
MMRPKPVSSLQKTYDDCYLMCSTAVYFEGQNNEEEALRSWRSALDTIYYHNAYRLPASYTPSTETERALQDSIRQLELQCRERVDLLDALRESRKDSSSSGKKKKSPSRSHINVNTTPGYIADGTVPAVGYTDLSKPPAIPTRPSIPGYTSSASDHPSPPLPLRPAPERSESQTSIKPSSRTPSPDRRMKPSMPSTLRDGTLKKKKKDSSRKRELRPVAASQAAGLAWGIISRSSSSDKTASDAAIASSRHTVSNDLSARRDQGSPRTEVPQPPSFYSTPSAADVAFTSSRPNLLSNRRSSEMSVTGMSRTQSADDHIPRRSPAKVDSSSTPGTPTLKRRVIADSRPHSGGRSRQSPSKLEPSDPPRSSASPKPVVKPKPVTLRSSQPQPPSAAGRSEDPSKPTSRSRAPMRGRGDRDLVPGIEKMAITPGSPARRKPLSETKRPMTPPSSDPDSLGRKSTDVDEGDEAEEREEYDAEDTSIMNILKKLPRGVDATAAQQVLNDIVVRGDEVHWDDIAGLDAAKKALKEAVVYPFLRPDLFSGLREPARGMLLFGPPGTGKTMLARAVATESKSTFFSVSASTLTSKWHGESEKLVRALFGLAKALAPSIIFVDEIDSLLSARSSGTENEASRRSKTEFLIQWSDLQRAAAGREQPGKTGDASRVLVLAATNMPWDIDEAARRRFVRRQYIPLPEHHVREQQLRRLLSHQIHDLNAEDIEVLVQVTEGFSGSDITALAKDAAMGPLRNLGEALLHTPMDQIRPICFADFEASLLSIRPSVSKEGLRAYEDWAGQFGERGG